MGKRYAVIGAGGSFGQTTCDYILKNASCDRMLAVGRNIQKPEAFSLNIGQDDNRYSYYAYHITHELDLLLELFDKEKPQVIINYAAQGEGAVSWKHSWRFFETNSMALAKLAEELGKRDYLERFIQIGTSELYGSVTSPSKESDPILPSSPYASSKAAFDLYLESIYKFCDFPMNIIRPSNAYCPGQLLHRIIPKTIVSVLKGEKVPLHGGGKAKKSYIHARDLARAITLVVEKGPLGTIYNVGPQEPTAIKDLVALVADGMGKKFEEVCDIVGDRLGQDGCYWLDSSAIKKDVGWEPKITLREGIKEMVDWVKGYQDQLVDWPMEYRLRA